MPQDLLIAECEGPRRAGFWRRRVEVFEQGVRDRRQPWILRGSSPDPKHQASPRFQHVMTVDERHGWVAHQHVTEAAKNRIESLRAELEVHRIKNAGLDAGDIETSGQ